MTFSRTAPEPNVKALGSAAKMPSSRDLYPAALAGGTAMLKILVGLRTFCYDCFVRHFRRAYKWTS
jgi:hypothetical protein